MKTKILFIFLLIAFKLSSQNEFNNWFFGVGNGLNFSTAIPTPILGSPINQTEGVASVSDASGNLLFYTTGVVVYDRTHAIMLNGNGLLGDPSSTQSSIIVKKPLSNTNYYIFTADADVGPDGIRWSEVDMSLNGGFGAVTANKNILLRTPSSEKLCAVRHCNGRDVWVISHDWGTNVFTSWLVNGVNNPGLITVWSSSGSVVNGANQSAYGQLKASSDGRKLAACYYGLAGQGVNKVEVYDFDNTTGIVSNALTLTTTEVGPYGCEFSLSGRILYAVTNQGRLSQWDLCAANIPASKVLINNMGPFGGSLQMANNGKIYISRGTLSILSSISFPEVYGVGCGLTLNAVTLTGPARFGLPNFPSYYLHSLLYPVSVTQTNCNTFCFTYPPPSPICSSVTPTYQWFFNDGTTQTGTTVCKSFSSNQTVLLTVNGSCVRDSIFIPVTVNSSNVNISPIYRNN